MFSVRPSPSYVAKDALSCSMSSRWVATSDLRDFSTSSSLRACSLAAADSALAPESAPSAASCAGCNFSWPDLDLSP